MTDLISVSKTETGELKMPPFKFVWLFYLIVGILLIAVIAFATFRPVLVLPRITLAPGYSLIDQNGHGISSEDMRGKITLYNITHSRCTAPCPETGLIMKEVQERLPEIESSQIPIELVTISVDPEVDTPEVLQEYARTLNADLSSWHFITGPIDRLKRVIGGGFGFYFNKQDDGDLIFDSGFVLVDGDGILRAEYRTGSPKSDRIMSDIELIIEEVQHSTGAKKAAYEAAHLFMCYPR